MLRPERECVPGDEVLVVTTDGRRLVRELVADLGGGSVTIRHVAAMGGEETLGAEAIEGMYHVGAVIRSRSAPAAAQLEVVT